MTDFVKFHIHLEEGSGSQVYFRPNITMRLLISLLCTYTDFWFRQLCSFQSLLRIQTQVNFHSFGLKFNIFSLFYSQHIHANFLVHSISRISCALAYEIFMKISIRWVDGAYSWEPLISVWTYGMPLHASNAFHVNKWNEVAVDDFTHAS